MPFAQPEDVIEAAVAASQNGDGYRAVLDRIPIPAYATGADGRVTYWNKSCIAFAGREPQLGQDRWCVTWQLYTMDGRHLPHDQCPMAQAIKDKRSIRSEIAIAMRPDGSRVAFRPYPTPMFDASGRLTGAINLLVDISKEQVGALKEQAARCRRLAGATHDRHASDVLKSMAAQYDETAKALCHA